MTTRHRDDYTAPVQLESLLEVPVKLILIEDLIREKAALASSGSVSYPRDKENEEENDYRRTGNGTVCPKKCLFDCCATPSRWRNTDCFSNNSQFRTASIALPWHDSLAVIPVMQVENPSISRLHMDAGANEDTDTDVEVSTKNSDDERVEKTKTPPIATSLPLTSPSSRIQNINSNISPSDEVEMDLSKKSKNDQDSNHSRTGQQTNPPSSLPSSPPATAVSVVVSSSAVLGKVIEKPTRYEDLISAHCGSSSESSANNANKVTKTSVSEKDHHQQDVIRESQEIGKQGSNNSADDTLKLTFYNEGRKETTKEFHTTMESGGASAGANDLRYFEHGLQMSRVIREPGSEVGFEGNVRMRPQQQQHLAVESSESRSGDNDKVSTDDNTQNPKSPSNANSHSTSSNNNSNNLSGTTASIITQPQQLRLTSSIIQNLNNINNNATTSNNSVISNENNGSTSHDKDASTNGKGRQWEGLQISRCQKEGTSVITLEGESNDRVSNMEIPSESSLNTTTNTRNPPESEKGENENSIERHLQTYLTSLRYVKPAESGSESGAGQETETSNKGRSPVISPQSRPTQTNIISPVISPHISSPGSRSGPGSVTSVVRMPSIQRVSPSQQASSLDSWPERTIARIPTRPFLRRNSTYELQQQQPHHQQPVLPRPPSYHAATQQPRMPTATTPISAGSASAAVITATPLQSPPKRFKASHVPPASPMMAHYQSQSQQSQQQYQQAYNLSNKYSNVNNPSEPTQQQHQSRMVTNVHPQQQISQQQQPHVPTSSNAPRIAQQHHHIQAYNNLHHYNQRQSTQTQHHTVTPSNAAHITQRPHFSPGNAQYTHQQQHQQQSQQQQLQQQQQQSPQQYQTKYHTNSNQQSQNNQQQQQQQLQFQRHLQESLLIASTAMASSSEPVDSSYNERPRRYCEFYHRQELDYSKLQEYYKKYGFYPWDILTARDESIIRQMKSQEYEQQQPEHYQYRQQPEAREGHTTSIANRYEMTRRVEMENAPLQQHHQHQIASRTMNVVNSPGRVAPHFSPSKPATLVAQAAMVPGNTHNSAVVASGRNANITPSIVSPHSSTVQNRYSHNNAQQLQQLHQQREYEVHQQRMNSRYFQSEHHHNQQQQQQQNYNHYEQQQQQQQQPRTVEMRGNTNYDIQNSPHYRSAYNQLAAAAAVVSAGTAAVVSQTQMRAVEQRPANTQNPVRHLIHAQAGGANNRPVVMTVSDPVPAPPDAVPLNIHRQALEQVIKSSQAATNLSMRGDTYGGVGSSRDINYRHAQGSTPTPSQNLHHVNHPMHQQQARQGQSYAVGRVRNEDSTAGGGGTQHKEPLRVVPSPTLAHQTSVIRRIQQQESPPAPFVPGQSHNRYMSDRPGISYRRLSSSSSSSADPSGEGGGQPTAFLYQQQKEMSSMHAQYQQQHQQHQSSLSANRRIGSYETGQAMQRGTLKRRIIITDNNGVNQNLTERCAGTASSPIPLIAGEEELVGPRNMSPSTIVRTAVNEELPEDDRADSGDGGGWQYDHVVLLDKRIKTYMCKRCFETLKTEQQIRNHLFCKMLANHVQCHVCLQLVTSDTYPAHLLIHGVRPPDNIEIDN